MRSISIATDQRKRSGSVTLGNMAGEITVYVAPYHAAAAWRRSMTTLLGIDLPAFGPSENIPRWLAGVGHAVAARVRDRRRDLPALTLSESVRGASTTLGRTMGLLMEPLALAEWADDAFSMAAADIATMVAAAEAIVAGPVSTLSGAHVRATDAAVAASMAQAADSMATVLATALAGPDVSELVILAGNLTSDDAWDEFILAVELEEHADHERAVIMMETLQAATTEAEADSVALWIMANFSDPVDAEPCGGGGTVE